MPPKVPKLLHDIQDAAAFIAEATRGKSQEDYEEDRLLRQAVERNFEIIGEAMRRLAQTASEVAAQVGDYPRIISFRNLLIHGYDLVEDAQVWKVVCEQVPELLRRVAGLLEQAD